jgi:uracil-DNA glycosylase
MEDQSVTFSPLTFTEEVAQTPWASQSLITSLTRIQDDERLQNLTRVLPERQKIFRVFRGLSPEEVKVVILGQDPYPTPGHACGLCFSYENKGAPPKSLINIHKELRAEGFSIEGDGNFSGWFNQGVLLLNTALTVEVGTPGSHLGIWDGFTELVLEQIPKNYVALLWGKQAQKYEGVIKKGGGVVLKAGHPSPQNLHGGFLGCGHFTICNEQLKKMGREPIEW